LITLSVEIKREEEEKVNVDFDGGFSDAMDVERESHSGITSRAEGVADVSQEKEESIIDEVEPTGETPSHVWAPIGKYDSASRSYARENPWETMREEVKTMREMREEIEVLKGKNAELEAKVEEGEETISRMRKKIGKSRTTGEPVELNDATKIVMEMDELVNAQLNCNM